MLKVLDMNGDGRPDVAVALDNDGRGPHLAVCSQAGAGFRRSATAQARTATRSALAFGPRSSAAIEPETVIDMHQPTARFEDIVEIRMLLDGVDSDRREALLLTQVLGLSYAEAAEICGCPVGTIRSRVARARDDLLRAGNQDQSAG